MNQDTRYYVKYLGGWYGIAGTDDDPIVTFLGSHKPNVTDAMIRKYKFLPPNEQSEVEICQRNEAVDELLAG